MLTTPLDLITTLKLSKAIPLLPYMPLSSGEEQLYMHKLFIFIRLEVLSSAD
jgi:hypothetical protein